VTNIRHGRLLALKTRIERQRCETELLLLEVHDFCRENPTVGPCIADDDAWIRQLERQHENLQAMLDAIEEKVAE
jgi:hypothetical protein